MRWVLRLIATGDDARRLSTDLVEICRPEGLGDIANLGLTLPEAKQLLASVQRAVVSGQVDCHGLLRPCCRTCAVKCHRKDWRGHCIATLFGEVTVRLPRFQCPACDRTETGVCWPSRCRSTPELDLLQAHLSALMSYRVAAGVLQHLLPIDAGRSPETLRHHTLRIGEQLGTATADQPTTAAAAAITVSALRDAAPIVLRLRRACLPASVVGFFHGAPQPHLDEVQHAPINDPAWGTLSGL